MPPWLAVGFGLVVAGGLALVFPYRGLEAEIARDPRQADALQIAYLEAWLSVRPSQESLRYLLARQLMNAGRLDAARGQLAQLGATRDERLAHKVLLAELDIATLELATLDRDDPQYAARRQALQVRLLALAQRRQAVAVDALDIELAQRAAALGARDASALLYERLLAARVRLSAASWEAGARAMLGVGDGALAARLYLAARDAAPQRSEQRRLFLSALRALQGAGLADVALRIAEADLGALATDTEVLEFLTRLALAAGRPDIAQRYAQLLLRLSLLPAAIEAHRAQGLPVPPAWLALLQQMPPQIVRVQATVAAPAADAVSEAELRRTPRLPFDERLYLLAYEVFLANSNLRDAEAVAQAAVRQRPRDRAWRLRLAQVADWSGQPQLALEQWHALAQQTQRAADWAEVERRAPAVFDTGRWLDALRFALTRRPNDGTRLRQLVSAYELHGTPERAVELLQRQPPGLPAEERRARLELLAELAERTGQDALHEATLAQLVREFGPRLPYALGQARRAYARGDLDAAFRALAAAQAQASTADATDDTVRDFWDAYADLAIATGRRAEAEAALRRLVASADAREDDFAALAALLEADRPLEAAAFAEQAHARFGTRFLALQALYLTTTHGRAADVRALLARLSPEALRALEADPRFRLQRAAFHLREGEAAAALRDARAALALDPLADEARALLIWALVAARDAPALRATLLAEAARAAGSAAPTYELAAPYAAGWLLLHEPQRALVYLRSAARTRDPLWLAALADAYDQLGQAEVAWQLRRLAWLAPPPEVAGNAARNDASQREAALQVARRQLTLASNFTTGDAVRARRDALLRDDPTIRDGIGRDAILADAITRGLSELAQAWLQTQYRDALTRPGWGEIAVALAADDRPRLAHLLDTLADWLPLYDRIDAAARVGMPARAQSLAFDALARLPDNEPLHRRLVENTLSPLEQAASVGVDGSGWRQRPLDELRLGSVATLAPAPGLWLQLRGEVAQRSSLDTAQFVAPTDDERSVHLTLGSRAASGGGAEGLSWQVGVQQRDGLAASTGVRAQLRWPASARLQLGAAVGLAQPASDNAVLRAGGARDLIDLTLDARLSQREFASLNVTFAQLGAQGGGRVGRAQLLRAEVGHRLRIEYPELTLRASVADLRYRAAPGLQTALLPLVPVAQQPFASNATLLPGSTTQFGLRLTCGDSAQFAYSRAWRPWCGVGLTHDADGGLRQDWQLGARGALFGTDQLWLGVGGGSGGGSVQAPFTELTLAYRWLF